MNKKIFSIILALAMSTGVCVSASAATEEVSGTEVNVADMIIGNPIYSDASENGVSLCSTCPNYATSKESWQLFYDGYIQFQPSYKTTSNDGCGLKAGRNVCQAWIDYERYDKSVIDGKKKTKLATSKTDDNIYSASASCMDSILDWSDAATTIFCRGWYYFA